MNKFIVIMISILSFVLLVGCKGKAGDEERVNELVSQYTEALNTVDVDKVFAMSGPDAVPDPAENKDYYFYRGAYPTFIFELVPDYGVSEDDLSDEFYKMVMSDFGYDGDRKEAESSFLQDISNNSLVKKMSPQIDINVKDIMSLEECSLSIQVGTQLVEYDVVDYINNEYEVNPEKVLVVEASYNYWYNSYLRGYNPKWWDADYFLTEYSTFTGDGEPSDTTFIVYEYQGNWYIFEDRLCKIDP